MKNICFKNFFMPNQRWPVFCSRFFTDFLNVVCRKPPTLIRETFSQERWQMARLRLYSKIWLMFWKFECKVLKHQSCNLNIKFRCVGICVGLFLVKNFLKTLWNQIGISYHYASFDAKVHAEFEFSVKIFSFTRFRDF